MINKYQFLNTKNTKKTIASVFISGNLALSLSGNNNIIDVYLSYAEFDTSGGMFDFFPYYGGSYERRIADNNYSLVNQNNFVTGYTVVQDLLKLYTPDQKNIYASELIQKISIDFFGSKVGVFFEDIEDNDTFVNISLERSVNLLETLTIKNNVLGQWKELDSQTGVVFGTLVATQKLKNDNGEFIKIPLRNVPILIFNQTQDIVTTIQPSDDNSRISVNMIENSNRNEYTNDFAYNFDQEILPSVTTKNVTDKYKYSTITNDSGEFILKDVPTGVRTMIVEIDLLKQGLTPEEVELNVAPYPKSNDLTPEQVPHLIYREIPIQVLPSWGTINTGYTRVDININVDLRKWTTYFVSPITAYGKTYDEILQAGFQPSLNIRVRDMANKGADGQLFPTDNIECVVIPDVTQRNKERLLGWFNEVRQLRELITFNEMTFNAFKLPANIYDPDAYKTDGSGNTISDKGVWLSSYEFRMFFTNENNFYRETGMNLSNGGGFMGAIIVGKKGVTNPFSTAILSGISSHFALNYESISVLTGVTVGTFPYEKSWTKDYPIKYSIPKLPNVINNSKGYFTADGSPTDMLLPKYLDGDRVGLQTSFNGIIFGGWGAQINDANDVYPNYFAQQVATSELYRYESAISLLDEFSNGYTPNYPFGNIPDSQKSQVKNGEIYQRVECGHAYFMWSQGYPRIINKLEYDEMYPNDFLKNAKPPSIPFLSSYLADNTLFNNDTLLVTDFVQIKQFQKGYIYLYRIVNPDPNTLAPPQPPLIKRFVKLNFQNTFMQRGGRDERARAVLGTSDKNHRFKFRYFFEEPDETKSSAIFRIKNTGIVSVELNIGTESVKIPDGDFHDFSLDDVVNMGALELPTNDQFDFSINTYYMTNYEMSVHNLKFFTPNGHLNKTINDLNPSFSVNDGKDSFNSIKLSGNTRLEGFTEYFLVSRVNDIRVRGPVGKPKPDGLVIDCRAEVDIQGLVLISSDITFPESYQFRLNNTGTDGGKGDNLPYRVLNS